MYMVISALSAVSTYVLLCDLLVNIHISQSKTHLSSLSNNNTVGRCFLFFQSGNPTGVLDELERKKETTSFVPYVFKSTAIRIFSRTICLQWLNTASPFESSPTAEISRGLWPNRLRQS